MYPSEYYISESKRVIETISYFGDFSDQLLPGESIITYTVDVVLFSGTDPTPMDMLYEGITLVGKKIEQRITGGIAGNIYTLIFTVGTDQDHTYTVITRLAIRPNATGTIPIFDILYETSCLYPQVAQESIRSFVGISQAKLTLSVINFSDYINSYTSIFGGTLIPSGTVNYSYGPEGITSTSIIQSGLLIPFGSISYSIEPEGIHNSIQILGANLIPGLTISYSVPAEGITSGVLITSGTLT